MEEASKKVEDGKSVRVRVDVEDVEVEVFGDFFMHPEEAIANLEEVLKDDIRKRVDEIADDVENYLEDENVELLGVSAEDIADCVAEARERDREEGG
ncbi:MAG: hypothetical protein SV760_08000 [Halobacteria archaeon]|nr:hypothetical protein [Halobacteria archaeon]